MMLRTEEGCWLTHAEEALTNPDVITRAAFPMLKETN